MRVYASAEMTLTDTNDGISVTGIDRYYMASSSSEGITVDSQGWKPEPQKTNPVSRYHWSYEVVNYSDGAKIPSKPAIIGVYGKEGVDAVTVSLSSEAHTFAGTETRAIASSITIDISAFKGNQRIPTRIGAVTGGIDGKLTHSELDGGKTTNKLVINVTNALDKSDGTLSIPIIADGKTFNKVFSWSVAFKGKTGEQGPQGIQGPSGSNGQSQWVHIRYSANSNGSGMDTKPSSTTKYVGIAVTNSATAPGYTGFTWSKYVGEDGGRGPQGLPGKDGDDGTTTYTWVKYADDKNGGGMNDYPEGKRFIGLAFNKTTQTESTTPSHYQWSEMPQNIEIGGRNLLPAFTDARWVIPDVVSIEDDYTISQPGTHDINIHIDVEPNTEYTYTFNSDYARSAISGYIDGVLNETISHLTTGSFVRTFNSGDNDQVRINISKYSKETRTATTHNLKLEKGNIATDWTPAPEDIQSQIDGIESGIGDLYLADKTGVLSGEEIYTDKADDDGVVHVEVDGKSYQYAGSGKNLFIPPRVIDGTMASQQIDNRNTLSPSGENEKFYEISGEPNKQYTFTFNYKHTQGQEPNYVKFFYSDGTDDGKSQGALDKITWTTKSITSKPNKTVVGIGYHNSETEWRVGTLEESIPFSRTVINDSTKLASESYIRKNGVNGKRIYSIEYKWVNGVKTSESRNKKLTSTINPVNEEYVQGTMNVVWKVETYNEPIKFSRTTIDDKNVLPADSYIRKPGVNGSHTYSIEYKWVNNVKTSETRNKKLVSTKNPVNEEYVRGTMVVEWKAETSTETIAFTRTTQDNSDIYPNESYVSRAGVNGSITYNLERKWVNGASTSETRNKVEASRKNAVNEIYIRGTKAEADNVTFNFTIDKTQTDKWYATPSVQLSNINRAPSSWRTMHLVDDFGAVGDGVTDDSQALKNALQHSNTEPIRLDVGGSEYEYYIPSNGNNRIESYPGVSKGIVIFGNGAVFSPKNERTIDKHEFYLMQIRAEKNAFVETSGFTIDGKHNPQDMFWWISQGKATRASDLPLQKGISYEGSDNIYIHDMTYRNMYGGYIIKLKEYTNVDIQNIRGYSVGGNDNPDSFGTIVHIDGQPDDSFINIDNMVIHGKKSPINPAWVSWIGIVIENGTTQSDNPSVRLADRNTNINVTNSEFYDFESLYHIETQAGNIYWNSDNVKARVMNYIIGAGVRGEIKERSNHMRLDILPFMRKGLSSGLYHTYRERPSNNLTDENGAFNHFHMYNSIINYLSKEDYVGGVDVHAVSHADSVVGNLHNVTLNNVPGWLVANASANLYDTQVNLKQGHNSSYSIFSNQEQYLRTHGTSNYNQSGSWKEASEGSYPPLAINTGFEAPPLTGKIGDILPPA